MIKYKARALDGRGEVHGWLVRDSAPMVGRAWIVIVVHGQMTQIEVEPSTIESYDIKSRR